MAYPIAKNTTVVAVKKEVTEGTYVAPASAADYIQVLPAFEVNPQKELVEREVLTSSVGQVQPRVGLRSVSGSLPVEFKAQGAEGGDPEYGDLLESALGTKRNISSTTTTKAVGNTSSVLQIQDADISKFNAYDVLVIKEPGAHHVCFVSAVDSTLGAANITVSPAASAPFSASVVISKNQMYYTANASHPSLSLSFYLGNEILQKAIGCKVSSLSLSNFTTGQVASWETSFDGLNYDRINGSAPHTPTYDSALPPIVVSQACVLQDGAEIPVKSFSVELANELGFTETICDGRTSSRVTSRKVSGSMDPYMDDTSVAQFTKFDTNDSFTLFAFAANPSSVTGELELGSVCAIVLPNCIITELAFGDEDGLLIDQISFSANRGSAGSIEEMYVGFV